jgi:hypothetical protein
VFSDYYLYLLVCYCISIAPERKDIPRPQQYRLAALQGHHAALLSRHEIRSTILHILLFYINYNTEFGKAVEV